MKAIINGIALEGTPKEIIEYQELSAISFTQNSKNTFADINEFAKEIERITKMKPIIVGKQLP